MIPKKWETNEVSPMFAQHAVWREFPGHSVRRGNQVEPEKLYELRRWSEESVETKAAMV